MRHRTVSRIATEPAGSMAGITPKLLRACRTSGNKCAEFFAGIQSTQRASGLCARWRCPQNHEHAGGGCSSGARTAGGGDRSSAVARYCPDCAGTRLDSGSEPNCSLSAVATMGGGALNGEVGALPQLGPRHGQGAGGRSGREKSGADRTIKTSRGKGSGIGATIAAGAEVE